MKARIHQTRLLPALIFSRDYLGNGNYYKVDFAVRREGYPKRSRAQVTTVRNPGGRGNRLVDSNS